MTNEEKTRESNLAKAARLLGRPVAPKPRGKDAS